MELFYYYFHFIVLYNNNNINIAVMNSVLFLFFSFYFSDSLSYSEMIFSVSTRCPDLLFLSFKVVFKTVLQHINAPKS